MNQFLFTFLTKVSLLMFSLKRYDIQIENYMSVSTSIYFFILHKCDFLIMGGSLQNEVHSLSKYTTHLNPENGSTYNGHWPCTVHSHVITNSMTTPYRSMHTESCIHRKTYYGNKSLHTKSDHRPQG